MSESINVFFNGGSNTGGTNSNSAGCFWSGCGSSQSPAGDVSIEAFNAMHGLYSDAMVHAHWAKRTGNKTHRTVSASQGACRASKKHSAAVFQIHVDSAWTCSEKQVLQQKALYYSPGLPRPL